MEPRQDTGRGRALSVGRWGKTQGDGMFSTRRPLLTVGGRHFPFPAPAIKTTVASPSSSHEQPHPPPCPLRSNTWRLCPAPAHQAISTTKRWPAQAHRVSHRCGLALDREACRSDATLKKYFLLRYDVPKPMQCPHGQNARAGEQTGERAKWNFHFSQC